MRFNSGSDSASAAAPKFSSRYFRRFVPGIGTNVVALVQ
jgi:hypothetical protein